MANKQKKLWIIRTIGWWFILQSISIFVITANEMPSVTITSPANGTVYSAASSITIYASASDSDGTVVRVEFYVDSGYIGQDTTSPYSYTWTTLTRGPHVLTAKAVDNEGGETISAAVNITINNVRPSVSLTSPPNNTAFYPPPASSITITASASDVDGTVTKVEFFYGGTNKIGEDTEEPYSVEWTNVPMGSYSITARATDNDGATRTSSARTIHVSTQPTAAITSPEDGTWYDIPPATITLSAQGWDEDPGDTISRFVYYRGSSGTTVIGTDYSPADPYVWSNVAGGTYIVRVRAYDNRNTPGVLSEPITLHVNTQPTVSLTAPANGAVFSPPPIASITVSANASDTDGTVAKVAFYANDGVSGNTMIGEDTEAPYSIAWTNVQAGTYVLTAVATDDRGATRTSSSRTIYVNQPPTAEMAAPPDGTWYNIPPATIQLSATASDPDGTVASLRFYRGGSTLIGTATYNSETGTWDYTWSNVASGTYVVTARATDNRGTQGPASAAITLHVNAAPTVSLTAPANGAVFSPPPIASITVSANASDTDGTVAKVAFYANDGVSGNTMIGEDTEAPYSIAWTDVQAGTYVLTAVATDDRGATRTSASRSIRVNYPPTVSLVSPTNGEWFDPPVNVTLVADPADQDGTITSVRFYRGSTLLGTVTSPPWEFVWENPAYGDHSNIRARAYDNDGTSTYSSPISIHINYPPAVALTAPAEGSIYDVPGTVAIAANASDQDGTVAQVAFYADNGVSGNTLIGTDTTSPYGMTWSDVPAGLYALTAVATDNRGVKTTSAAVNIQVGHRPVAQAQDVETDEDTPLDITLHATDADGDPLTYEIVSQPAHGILTGEPPDVIYIPAENYFGEDSFTFKAFDGIFYSTPATITITVHPVNDPPLAEDQELETSEDTAKPIALTAQHPENENQTLSFEVVALPQHGELTGEAPNLVYTPAPDYSGPDYFTFRVFDGIEYGNTGTVTISVAPVNDPPVIESISASPERGLAPLEVSFSVWASDVDSQDLSYHWDFGDEASSEEQNPAHTYTAPGSYTVTLTVTDSGTPLPAMQAQAQVQIVVLVPVQLKGLDQNNDRATNAQIWVSEYDAWYAEGSVVGLPADKAVDFKGMMLDAEGSLGSTVILADTTGIVVPFQKVTFVARDQYNADVPGAQIYVGVYDADPFPSGTYITLPVGATVSALGYVNNKLGPKKSLPISGGVEECVVDFWKATLLCKDQNGSDVANGKFAFPGALGSPYAAGSQVVFPKGILLRANAVSYGINGPQMSILYKDQPSFTAQFWTLTVKCRDQFDVPVPSGLLLLSNNTTFADNSAASLPRGAAVSARAKRVNLVASAYDSYLMDSGLEEINAKFRSVTFNAVATDGSTLVPGAQIEIYGSGLPRFANATAQALPYNSTLSSVRVYSSSNVLIANKSFAVTADSDTITIVTSWVAP